MAETGNERDSRTIALLGEEGFAALSATRVAIVGLGGVGSWCAEALVRTGVRSLLLVDDDTVATSNMNRQRQASPQTVGRPKAEVLREILLGIAPDAEIDALAMRYSAETAAGLDGSLRSADFIIDAIDSVDCKALLIATYSRQSGAGRNPVLFSSLGAALRTDPTQVRTAPFRKISGDGLARALRARFRKEGIPLPDHKCVYSEQTPAQSPVRGSIMPVTCAFGMALASLVVYGVCSNPVTSSEKNSGLSSAADMEDTLTFSNTMPSAWRR